MNVVGKHDHMCLARRRLIPNNVSSNPHGNGNSIENDFDNDNGIGNCTVVLRSMMASVAAAGNKRT